VGLAGEEITRLSQITKQTLAPHRESKLPVVTKLSVILDDTCAMFQPQLHASSIEVKRNYVTEGEVTIHASELWQVFNNLISNAIDATERNGRIELTVESSDPDEVVIMVCDTGCGIPAEHLETIYQPFFTTKGEKGTGIGLWVVKGIVERRGQHFGRYFDDRSNGNMLHHRLAVEPGDRGGQPGLRGETGVGHSHRRLQSATSH